MAVGRFNDLFEMMESYILEIEQEEIIKTISENPNFETEYSTPKEALKAVIQWQENLDSTVDLEAELRKLNLFYNIKPDGTITVGGERVVFKNNKYGKVKPFLGNTLITGKNFYRLVAKLVTNQKPEVYAWEDRLVRRYTLQCGIQSIEINQVIDDTIIWFKAGYSKEQLKRPFRRIPTYTGKEKLNEGAFPEIALQKVDQTEILLEELEELASTSDAAAKVIADRSDLNMSKIKELEVRIEELKEELLGVNQVA